MVSGMILGLVASLVLLPVAAGAQEAEVEITAPSPEPVAPLELVLPGQPPEISHSREGDFRSDDVRTRHDPAFIAPFTRTVQTGPTTAVRFGLSGWTAPPGRGDLQMVRETSGWFALGLTIVWDVPVEPPKAKASPAPSAPR